MELSEIKRELEKMVPDFAKKVAPVYYALEWEWSPGRTSPHIPSIGELETTLYDLIRGLTDEYVKNGTGGLVAYYSLPEDDIEPGHYGLALELLEDYAFD